MIAFRHGIDLSAVLPKTQVLLAILVASDMYRVLRRDCIIMSVTENSVCLRVKHIPIPDRGSLVSGIRSALQGEEKYSVALEGEGDKQLVRISYGNGSTVHV